MAKPAPKFEKEAEPLIPYVDPEDFDPILKERSEKYSQRMGFLPNCNKLYAHRPAIAAPLWDLNSAIMRDESSTLPQGLKRRIATRLAKLNNSTYCVSHHCGIMQREDDENRLKDEGWGVGDEDVRSLLVDSGNGADDFEKACFDFADAMTLDPTTISDEIYDRIKQHLSPAQIVELSAVVGFWKLYNTIHSGLKVPLEEHLLEFSGWINAE
jgi:uncharacterized peroxidase-related enzyme